MRHFTASTAIRQDGPLALSPLMTDFYFISYMSNVYIHQTPGYFIYYIILHLLSQVFVAPSWFHCFLIVLFKSLWWHVNNFFNAFAQTAITGGLDSFTSMMRMNCSYQKHYKQRSWEKLTLPTNHCAIIIYLYKYKTTKIKYLGK